VSDDFCADYAFIHTSLRQALTGAEIWDEMLGSDHCPIVVDFDRTMLRIEQTTTRSPLSSEVQKRVRKLYDTYRTSPNSQGLDYKTETAKHY